MSRNSTKRIQETTIYRILGDGHAHIGEFVLRDAFTCTLLAMVLATYLMIILVPVSLKLLDFDVARILCQTAALSLLPGYTALIVMLISRCKGTSKVVHIDKGQLTLSHVPRIRNTIIGIQCVLFASLLCSTFIMRQQLSLIQIVDPGNYTEHVLSKEEMSTDPQGISLLPLLREYISM